MFSILSLTPGGHANATLATRSYLEFENIFLAAADQQVRSNQDKKKYFFPDSKIYFPQIHHKLLFILKCVR